MHRVEYTYTGQILGSDAQKMVNLRQYGEQKDVTAVASMVAALQHPIHPACVYVAMHSLAKIGNPDALAAIKDYENIHGDEGNFAKVSKARLLAEAASAGIVDVNSQATIKVHRFFSDLELTPDNLNKGTLNHYGPQTRFSRITGSSQQYVGSPQTTSVEVYAMRELADIVYHGSYAAYTIQSEVAQTNFQIDYPSALKIRLAAIPNEQRLPIIIQELSHKKTLKGEDDYEIQLAINEGDAAASAAASRLRLMETNRGEYSGTGFAALFRVIGGTGDKRQVGVIQHFLDDSDRDIAYYSSQIYEDVKNGRKSDRVIAY